MSTDLLYVIDLSMVPHGLTGREIEEACWNARVAIPELHGYGKRVTEFPLDFHACWAGVFEDGANAIAFESILFRDSEGNVPDEPLLGLLDDRHLERMIASVEVNRHRVRVGTAEEQLRGLRAIREACRASANLRAGYHMNY